MRNAALLLLLLAAACRAPAKEAPPPAPTPQPAPSAALDEAQWRAEAEAVFVERQLALAKAYRDALDLGKAMDHVEQVLRRRPTEGRALAMRAELQRMMGEREGEVRTLVEDEWLAMQAREEQRVVETRRLLDEARAAEEAGDLQRAATLYQRALFLSRQR